MSLIRTGTAACLRLTHPSGMELQIFSYVLYHLLWIKMSADA